MHLPQACFPTGFCARRLAGVAERVDHHAAFLTVKETLEFARNCGQVWTYKDYGPEMKVRGGGGGGGRGFCGCRLAEGEG